MFFVLFLFSWLSEQRVPFEVTERLDVVFPVKEILELLELGQKLSILQG